MARTGSRAKLSSSLKKLLGSSKVIDDEAIVRLYAREPSGVEASETPIAVVFPESVSDVSRLLAFAYKNDIKVFPQGSTTSLSGSAAPLEEGIVLSMERMSRIGEISVIDSYAIAEAGVRIDELNLVLAKHGYMFPVDPASSSVATIGGAVNSGAGGMRGAKYGTMRDWVLGLRIVLADENGTAMWIGCRTVKCRQGYDLVRLIVGSEGTLAVVTEAILRITPLPENIVTVLAFFPRLEDLASTVIEIKKAGVQPYIMEFLDEKTVKATIEFTKTSIPAEGNMLLVSVDVNREATDRVLEWLKDLMKENGAESVYAARSLEEAEEKKLFEIRRSLFPAQNYLARVKLGIENPMIYIEDIAVPPSRLVEAVEGLRSLEEKYGLYMLMGGHIGDGNLHPAVGFDPTDKVMARKVEEWYMDVMRLAIELGGTVSSEHGIGTLKKKGLAMELERLGSTKALELMKGIKKVFDPKGILNPGKIF